MRVLVFDSGIGGVGIARAVRLAMPGAAVSYLMDDAGFPYGGRGEDWVVGRVLAVVGAGIARVGPDIVVVACNTASTVALAALRAAYGMAFVGCVPPVKSAAAASRSRVIGVLATPATVRGAYLRGLVDSVAANCRVLVHGAVGLAGLAERRFAGGCVTASEVAAELAGLVGQDGAAAMDAVALGCTHYGLLLGELAGCVGADVAWLDPAKPVAGQVARVAAGIGAGGAGMDDGVVFRTGTVGQAGAGLAGAGWGDAGFCQVKGVAV